MRGAVARLNVGLEPDAAASCAKRVANDGSQSRAHEALPLEPREDVVAEIRAAECAEHDLVDVDDADDRAACGVTHTSHA